MIISIDQGIDLFPTPLQEEWYLLYGKDTAFRSVILPVINLADLLKMKNK